MWNSLTKLNTLTSRLTVIKCGNNFEVTLEVNFIATDYNVASFAELSVFFKNWRGF